MAGGLQLRDRRSALAVDARLELAGGLVALGLGLAQLALALADALLGEPAGRGDRESHRVVEDLGDAVCLGLGHVDHFLLVVACVRLAGQAAPELLVALAGDSELALEARTCVALALSWPLSLVTCADDAGVVAARACTVTVRVAVTVWAGVLVDPDELLTEPIAIPSATSATVATTATVTRRQFSEMSRVTGTAP